MTEEQKSDLAQTVAEKLPWIDVVTARQAIGVIDDEGALRFRGREVLPSEIPKGAMGRVEYDVLTKNHMTGEFVITRHMEITSRNGLNLTARPLIDQQVKNVRYFVVEEAPPASVPEKPGHRFKATNGNGPVEWEFATLVDDRIVCIDTKDFTGQVWHRHDFESLFTVTEVLS